MLIAIALLIVAAPKVDALSDGFQTPPASARPHTWWHWMDGNVTKAGITADLEAMREVGIGGAQMFTVAQGIPKGPVGYMSPEWRDMTKFAIQEANRLGIELCLHNCAGWSSSGAPWVTPENAMQVIAWSEVKVSGPRRFDDVLPQPKAPQVFAPVPYYRDIVAYAFPTPKSSDSDPQWLGKTGVIRQDWLKLNFEPEPSGVAIKSSTMVKLDLDDRGKLTWDVPAGDWTILRIGHVPTGKNNHPAPPEGEGLEVDKLSREALDAFWAGGVAKIIADAGPLAGKTLNNALVDSYEVGSQNWTKKMREEFRRRRGYDPLPYLPTIAGRVIESQSVTERFLWDLRRTIADLFAENYFGYFAELCHKNGLLFSTEPYGSGGFNAIEVGGKADIPMGEFWVGGGAMESVKVASSVGHIYGRPIIGAESFTADDVRGKWMEEPYAAKATGDLVFTHGINRYIFHRYAHQPWMNLKPGMTMGPWGTHLERTQTWWTEAATWMKYIARCQFLLQQGTFVADTLYYMGDSSPMDWIYGPWHNPPLPSGYDYDSCDTTILNRIVVRNGRCTLPSGMSYRILSLPEVPYMTPEVARTVARLVRAGATVVGPKPLFSPSLTNQPQSDQEVAKIGNEVWGMMEGKVDIQRTVGKGKIIAGKDLSDVYREIGYPRDFEYKSLSGGSKLVYIHRQIKGSDFYFVSNQNYRPSEADCTFRVKGKTPELWHPDTGVIEPAPIFREDGDRTVVHLQLDPAESVFVVFRSNRQGNHLTSFGHNEANRTPIPTIAIKNARYESADGRGADVTAIVSQLVREGQYEITASNSLFGDPVVNVVKQLKLTYTVNGKIVNKVLAENETQTLIEFPGAVRWEYDLSHTGTSTYLTSWKAGTYVGAFSNGRKIKVSTGEPQVINPKGWSLSFPPNWGAPASVQMTDLVSWTEHPEPGIRYFSGSATYRTEFNVPSDFAEKNRVIELDLGRVKNFATVKVNGKEIVVLWKEPFKANLSGALKPGANRLEVKVTNLWPNRIIGDEQLPADVEWNGVTLKEWPEWLAKGQPRPKTGRFTFATWRFWNKDSKVLESGLLGPVVLRSAKRVNLVPN